jgi:ISXO2-like transposase domain
MALVLRCRTPSGKPAVEIGFHEPRALGIIPATEVMEGFALGSRHRVQWFAFVRSSENRSPHFSAFVIEFHLDHRRSLVDRDGESRSFHIANVKAKTLREKIVTTVNRKAHLMTDELASYEKIGKEFANHDTVNHSANEFAKFGGFVHTNTAECRFSLMKRAVFGTHHSISEAHLPRCLAEWDFKWNTRDITDGERAALALKGAEGRRLTYRQPREAPHT